MFPSKGERIISNLRWPSLALLTLLLSIFLFKSFISEKQRIEKEVGLLFINAVKTLEGSLLNQWILDSLTHDVFMKDAINDSVKILAFQADKNQLKDITLNRVTTSPKDCLKIVMRKNIDFNQTHISTGNLTESKGVISIMMKTDHMDSIVGSKSVFSYQFSPDTNVSKKIMTLFDENLQKAGIKLEYTFKTSKNEEKPISNIAAAGVYKDLASGKNYAVQINNPNLLAIKSIWLEILLSALLLICLGLAFYSMSRTIAQERSLMQSKNDFIQNMTHELKTPITTVKVALEGIHEFDGLHDLNKRDEYLSISKQELERLSILVDRVLSVSKLDKELPPATKEKINLNELVHQIAETCKVQALKQNAVIEVHSTDTEISLLSDKQWLSGIVYNLIENAIKYADKAHTQIDIFLSKMNGDIVLKVQDNGPGIAEEYQSKIFEKFYRIPTGNVHTVKGHGLGLAFVKRMLKELGGTISLKSEEGKGSIFSITLPA